LFWGTHGFPLCFDSVGWTITNWLSVALVPAGLYAIQNMASLTAYQNLDALTYNTLNQTKTLSAALCCYLVMGRKQSSIQIFSLFLLLLSALVMEGVVRVDTLIFGFYATSKSSLSSEGMETGSHLGARHFTHGVAPILLASFISGLAGALSQKNLQAVGGGRNAYLFTMELCAASCLILLISLVISSDGQTILTNGFWKGWQPSTFIPILTNSAGGIVVGLVTKYAGSVRKGFALIFGILLSGIIQAVMQSDMKITNEQVLGGAIAAVSLYLHAANPPKTREKQD
jgi:solute carrier family 35 (UDP-sugar transporter), member A1/2/3